VDNQHLTAGNRDWYHGCAGCEDHEVQWGVDHS
jgi:hypothetical protein